MGRGQRRAEERATRRRAFLVAALLTATVCWASDGSGAPVGGGVGRELGVHYGSPLRLSAHASAILDNEIEVVRGVDRLEGPELLVEAGIGGGRVGVGWGRRGTPYLHGWSVGLGVIRTWASIDDPHGHEPGRTLGSLSGRSISLGATLRGELLYDFDAPGDRWGLGWSVGLVLW